MADETTETQGTQNPADTNLPAEPTTPTTPAADNVLTFTQEQLDAKMASHKRMLQRDLAAARTQAAAANDLKTKVQELLDLGIVPEGSTVDDLGQALDGLLTDKERFERETATKTAELEAASQQATEFKTLFQDQTRVNSLEQAMNEDGGKMVNEGAKELVLTSVEGKSSLRRRPQRHLQDVSFGRRWKDYRTTTFGKRRHQSTRGYAVQVWNAFQVNR